TFHPPASGWMWRSVGVVRGYRMVPDLGCPCTNHDPGPGILLRWFRRKEERASYNRSELRGALPDKRTVGTLRLQPSLRAGLGWPRADRYPRMGRSQWGRLRAQPRLRGHSAAPGIHDIPVDVRDHHASTDNGVVRRSTEV